VTTNDIGLLSLKAARRDAIANLQSFETSGYQPLNFGHFIYSRFALPPYAAVAVIAKKNYGLVFRR